MKNDVIPFSKQLMTAMEESSDAIPVNLNRVRWIQNSLAVLNGNETLKEFSMKVPNAQAQIKAALLRGAFQGLDFYSGEAYLVPFKDQLNFMISHKGAVKMAKRYSTRPIKEIYAKIVKEGDAFEAPIKDGVQTVNFNPNPFNDGKIIGAFAVCEYEDGGIIVEIMSLKELENCRASSRAKNSPAWIRHTSEMYRKTILHRLCKQIPIDMDAQAWDAFNSGTEIVTDVKEEVAKEIEENANQEEFMADFEVINE